VLARLAATSTVVILALAWVAAQGTAPPTALVMVTREGRTPVPTILQGADELIALDEVAALFMVTVREDTQAGGVRVTYRDRSIVVSAGQSMASVNGRVITLPSPVTRAGGRWLVPVEFLPRALGQIYDRRIDLRRASRLLAVGDIRVVRVTARVESGGPPTRAVVDIVPGVPVTATTDGAQVLLRIDADALDLAPAAAGAGLVVQSRGTDRGSAVALTLADAAGPARVSSTVAPERTRVTIEMPAAAAAASAEPVPAAPSRPAVPYAETPAPLAAPSGGIRIVALDPGHGGDDVGARSGDGLGEKQLTLEVARRLRTLLETRLGLRVILTRDDDRSLGPDARAAAANAGRADLLISLHANGAFSPEPSGAEVLALRPASIGTAAGDTGESYTIPAIGGATRTLEFVRWDQAQASHAERAWEFAALVEAELRTLVPMGARPLRQVPLRTLAGANMPAVQVEMAYLTNPEQAREAATDDFKGRVAQALFQSVTRLVSGPEARTP